MQVIIFTKNDNLRYTLSPTRQELVYQKLVKVLHQDFASVFLKPRIKSNGIEWGIADDSIDIYETHTYSQLGEDEQNLISEKLSSLSSYIKQNLEAIPELKNKIERIIDIPGLDSAKLLKTNRGDIVVLSDWAHVRFDKKRGYSPFEKIVNKPRKVYPVKLKFIYTDGSLFKNQPVQIIYKGFPKKHNSGEYAQVDLGKVPVSSNLGVSYLDQNKVSKSTNITTLGHQEDYEITIPLYTSLRVNVKDQNGNLLDNYPIAISSDGIRKEIESDHGVVFVEDLIAGKSVEIIDRKNNSQSDTHTLSREPNELDFIINFLVTPPPVLEYLSFYVYDYNNELIKDAEVAVLQKNNTIKLDSEAEGEYKALKRKFILDQKSKVKIDIDQNGKKKNIKHKFKIVKSQDEYHLRLKRNYWWFLLLLIPLLLILLLSFQKSIVVQLVDEDGNRIQSSNVEMSYDYNALFDFNSATFFSKTNYSDSKVTDEKGNALFEALDYTVLDRVFYPNRKTQFVVTSNDTCYIDTVFPHGFYSYRDTFTFKLANQTNNLDIRVLSNRTSKPISGAQVEFVLRQKGKEYQILRGTTNDNGVVIFSDVPVCGEVEKVIAKKPDYFPDSILNKVVYEISGDINDRTLYLIDPVPCDNKTKSGDVRGGEVLLSVPYEEKTYIIDYNFIAIKDRLVLYSGNSKKGKMLYDSGWTSGRGSVEINPKSFCGGCDYITAVILTNDSSTSWNLSFECPQ